MLFVSDQFIEWNDTMFILPQNDWGIIALQGPDEIMLMITICSLWDPVLWGCTQHSFYVSLLFYC